MTTPYDDFTSQYLKEINRIPLLSQEEENTLAKKAAEGDEEARKQLITANLRFVVFVAKKYQNRGFDLNDLINEGNIGLITAAQHFDPSRGCRFITYAVSWIRQCINRAICERGQAIHIPMNHAGETEFFKPVISLDAPVGIDGNSSTFGDFIEDERYSHPEDVVQDELDKEELYLLIKTLPAKERRIIKLRFGLGKEEELSFQEVANRVGLSKERIRQLVDRSLTTMRKEGRVRHFDSSAA